MKATTKLYPEEIRQIIKEHFQKRPVEVHDIRFSVGQKYDYRDQLTGYALEHIAVDIVIP